jgi:hypothetical protein
MTVELYHPLRVGFFDRADVLRAGEKAAFLYLQACAWSVERLTDGFVADVQLRRFGLSDVTQRATKLVECGLWERVDGGFRIRDYLKEHKTKAEIEQHSAVKKHAAKLGNHVRWHVKGHDFDSSCEFCVQSQKGSQVRSQTGSQTGSQVGQRSESTESDSESDEESLHWQRERQQPTGRGKTPVPEEYMPSPPLRKWAEDKGLSPAEINLEADKFRDYHKSYGNERVDWDAAFKTWILKVEDFRPGW